MIRLMLAAAMIAVAAPAFAQDVPSADTAQIAALIAKAKAQPPKPVVSENIVALAPYYRANLEYRTAVAPAYTHKGDAELMVVLDGAGTLVEGGRLVDEKGTDSANPSGSSIAGGTRHALAKGDVAFVPQGTPHQLLPAQGRALVLMTLHVPRTSDDHTNAKLFATAAEISALRDKAKAGLKPGAVMSGGAIVNLAPYRVGLEYRVGARKGGSSVHQHAAEFMYGLGGSGTVTTGGTMIDPKPAHNGNVGGSGIADGTVHHMAAGDVLFVPYNTPHQILAADGGDLVLMTLHVPWPAPQAGTK